MGFLLVTSGLVAWLRRPRLVPPWDACICLVVFLATVAAQVAPLVADRKVHPKAPNAVQRSPGQSQMWGLTVPELVMPTVGHRIPKLRIVESRRSIGQGADPSSPRMDTRMSINEKYFNALGVVGSSGFFFLLLILLAGGARWVSRFEPVSDLAKLNIASVLLGSGFALLVEVFVPEVRAYNRIAIYIAFFSLFGAALIAQKVEPRFGSSSWSRASFLAAVVAITALGLLDEIPVVTPDHRKDRETYAAEADYVHKLEAMVDRGARIFQLPYSDFLEGRWGYNHSKLFVHSGHIRMSFGAARLEGGLVAEGSEPGTPAEDARGPAECGLLRNPRGLRPAELPYRCS